MRRFLTVCGLIIAMLAASIATASPALARPTGQPALTSVTPGDGSLTVTYDEIPASGEGSSPITTYTAETPAFPANNVTVPAGAGTATITGLTNGFRYKVRVAGNNGSGQSPGAISKYFVPGSPGQTSGPPKGLQVQPGNGNVELTWEHADDPGDAPRLHYHVISDDFPDVVNLDPSITSYTLPGLDNGTAYNIQVTSSNIHGEGENSNSVIGIPGTAPGAPTIGNVEASNGGVTVSWTPPASDGENPIQTYVVTAAPSGEQVAAAGFATEATFIGLEEGSEVTFTVVARNQVGDSPPSGASAPFTVPEFLGLRYEALAPSRILDTREGNGAPLAPLGEAKTLDLQITGRGGVPAAGVSAVVLNMTATNPTAPSFLTAWPGAGLPRPNASNLNFVAGQSVPNLVTVKVSVGGSISIYNHSGSTDVVADVVGWYDQGNGTATGLFGSLPPSRLLDTRSGLGGTTGAVGERASIDLGVLGIGGVPATGVTAVVLNVTVDAPTASSFATVYPKGVERPNASNLNFVAGQTVPNQVIAKVGDNGMVSLYNHNGSVHMIADVVGYFDDGSGDGGSFGPVNPTRILDTRDGQGQPSPGKVGPDGSITLKVAGLAGVADSAAAVIMNVTVTEPTEPSFLTVYPSGSTRPTASNLNYVAGQTVPNLVTAKIGTDGTVTIYNLSGSTHVIADVVGWYT